MKTVLSILLLALLALYPDNVSRLKRFIPLASNWQGSDTVVTHSGDPYYLSLYNRIITQESRGDCQAVNRHSGALGLGQVMPDNVKSWSEQCLGIALSPSLFKKSCAMQEHIVRCKLREYADKALASGETRFEACRSAAATWYSGKPERKNDTAPRGEYPSIADYTRQVCNNVQS